MEGSSNYLAIGALAAAGGSYVYTYNQIQNLQKELSKITDSINNCNESVKTYDENVKDNINRLVQWTNEANESITGLADRIISIEKFLAFHLQYEMEEPEYTNHPRKR